MCSRNCYAQELREQTAMQDLTTENCGRKSTHLMMWVLFNLLMRRYLPSNPQNNWLYAAAATKKKGFAAKSFCTSSVFSHSLCWWVGKSKSVYISLIIVQAKSKSMSQQLFIVILKMSGEFLILTVPRRHREHRRQSAFLRVTSPNVDRF